MIPLAVPNIGPREWEYVQECLRDNWVSSVGPFVSRLEQDVASLCGVQDGVAVAAGTMGLHAALLALGVGTGDVVALPAYTFIASANAIAHSGARPWLFDIADNWTISPSDLAAALKEDAERDRHGVLRLRATGERVAAIMPVYTLGMPADMDAIASIAAKYGLPVIADAAAAIGARYKGRSLGGLADFTVFSFNGNKTITTGGGGMVVGPKKDAMARVRHLTTTARVGVDYDHDQVGYNYRMTNVEAAIGCAQMERLSQFLEAKNRIRETYDAAFADNANVESFPTVAWAESTHWFSGLVIREESGLAMEPIIQGLAEGGVMARKFWKPMHLQPPFARSPQRDLRFSDKLWRRVLTLPCSTSLSKADQDKVIEILRPLLRA